MIADRLAVDDRSECTAEVPHMITAAALLDDEVITRQPEWRDVFEREMWPQRRRFLPCNRSPANDEGQITDPDWSVQLMLQPRILGGEIRTIDSQIEHQAVGPRRAPLYSTGSPFVVDDTIVGLAQPLTEALN